MNPDTMTDNEADALKEALAMYIVRRPPGPKTDAARDLLCRLVALRPTCQRWDHAFLHPGERCRRCKAVI